MNHNATGRWEPVSTGNPCAARSCGNKARTSSDRMNPAFFDVLAIGHSQCEIGSISVPSIARKPNCGGPLTFQTRQQVDGTRIGVRPRAPFHVRCRRGLGLRSARSARYTQSDVRTVTQPSRLTSMDRIYLAIIASAILLMIGALSLHMTRTAGLMPDVRTIGAARLFK